MGIMGIRRIINYKNAETLGEGFRMYGRVQPYEQVRGIISPKSGNRLSDLFTEFPPVNNRALWFNGCSSHVSLPSVVLIPNASYTIEFWIYLYNAYEWRCVFIQGTDASPSFQIVVLHSEEDIVLCDGESSGVPFRCAVRYLYMHKWQHVAFTRDAAGPTYRGYLNGNDVTRLSHWVISANSSGYNFFGCRYGTTQFDGSALSEFRIWDTVRTQQQIRDNMYKNVSPSETGLIGYWKLNDGDSTVVDSTSRANHGTTQNEVAWLPPR